MKTIFMAMIAVGMIGCANSSEEPIVESCHEYVVYIEDSFAERRQALLKEAAERWSNEALNLHLTFQVVSLEKIHQVQYTAGSIVIVNHDPGGGLAGSTGWGSEWAIIQIPDAYGRKYFRATAIHEFGHAFHLGHTANKNSVMFSGDSQGFGGLDITCDDLEEFCSKWECKSPMICQPN